MSTNTEHPHIEKREGVCGGRAVVKGTRMTVAAIAGWMLKHQIKPEEMLEHWPQLSLASVHDAMSYYYDHKDVIDEEIRVNEDEEHWKSVWQEAQARRAEQARAPVH